MRLVVYMGVPQAKQAQMGKHKDLNLTDWKPPTDSVNLSYRQWLDLALKHGKGDGEHWYFRVGDANNKVRVRVRVRPKARARVGQHQRG